MSYFRILLLTTTAGLGVSTCLYGTLSDSWKSKFEATNSQIPLWYAKDIIKSGDCGNESVSTQIKNVQVSPAYSRLYYLPLNLHLPTAECCPLPSNSCPSSLSDASQKRGKRNPVKRTQHKPELKVENESDRHKVDKPETRKENASESERVGQNVVKAEAKKEDVTENEKIGQNVVKAETKKEDVSENENVAQNVDKLETKKEEISEKESDAQNVDKPDVNKELSTDSIVKKLKDRLRKGEQTPEFVLTRQELNKIRLPRHKLELWFDKPFFNQTVIGSFVRVGIFDPNDVDEQRYEICEVLDVTSMPHCYQVGNKETKLGLVVKVKGISRVFPIYGVSDDEFTQKEFDKWQRMLIALRLQMPTKSKILAKLHDIRKAIEAYRSSRKHVK